MATLAKSASGTKRTFTRLALMSAFDPKRKRSLVQSFLGEQDAYRDEQDIHDRDENRPEQESENCIKEGRNEPGDRSGRAFARHN